jgi:hypothetical protein
VTGAVILRWVFEAKKRFGLSVLDYMVTLSRQGLPASFIQGE